MNRNLQALEIFEEALGLPSDAREAFLKRACMDADLLEDVLALLSNAEECDDFLDTQSSSSAAASQTDSAKRFQMGSVLQSRYEIIKVLGQGGMGEVYLGRDQRLERPVAIKVVKQLSNDSDELRERFDRELKSVAQLSCANVVTLFDYVLDETPFAVMEYVDGETLESRILQGIASLDAVKIAIGIASGLETAHRRELIHRDIKPANVIVTPEGNAKILDFGLARSGDRGLDQKLTQSSVTPGTIPYMSPEQADGRALTCATDIFSFGTVLYEMLCGRNPFRCDSALATMNCVVEANPPRLDTIVDNLPSPLVDLVHAMLRCAPSSRPAAGAIAEVLSTLASGVEFQLPANLSPTTQVNVVSTKPDSTRNAGLERTRLGRSREWQPTLIILPFQSFGTDDDLTSLADGLVENLTTILTRVPMLSITSRMTSFSLKGESITANQIRERFKVDYMVEGSLQRVGSSVRANVQLIETQNESHAWAQQFDCEYSDGVLDELLFEIIPKLERQLVRAILTDLQDADGSPTSRHMLVRAMSHLSLRGWHQDSFAEVIAFLQESLELDPNLAMTHAYLALIQGLSNRVGLSRDAEAAANEARHHADVALELDDLDSNVLGLVGCALTDIGELQRGEELLYSAIDVNPRNAQAHAALGTSSLVQGDSNKAIEHLKKGIELSPVDGRLAVWYASLAIAYLQTDQSDDALEAAKRGCRSDRKSYLPRVALAAVHMVRKKPELGLKALEEGIRVKPDLSDDEIQCLVGRRLGLGLRKLRRSLKSR